MFNRQDEGGEVSSDFYGRVEERDTSGTPLVKLTAYSGHGVAERNL